ncbi:Stem-specific protein TSJT1 [Ananas comosus]|uniref:Stem-specific protein TSJT1 n=1 Tax=Ananas comosus TaxID=4615 RepID=A0A199V678_ANACO|nr:Stem-specific protein TSJT1 [Ananas comosus]
MHGCRRFAAKEEIFCVFEGMLDNLGSLWQQYGLSSKGGAAAAADEAVLVIEAYKALRDRAPYPPSFMLAHLSGDFAFVLFDRSTSSLLVASVSLSLVIFFCLSRFFSDPNGKIPLFWGITADGCVAFSDDVDLLKGSCGKSLAQFPQGCFYSNSHGGLRSFENPKHRVTAIPADEEEICGATFKVEGAFVAATI